MLESYKNSLAVSRVYSEFAITPYNILSDQIPPKLIIMLSLRVELTRKPNFVILLQIRSSKGYIHLVFTVKNYSKSLMRLK